MTADEFDHLACCQDLIERCKRIGLHSAQRRSNTFVIWNDIYNVDRRGGRQYQWQLWTVRKLNLACQPATTRIPLCGPGMMGLCQSRSGIFGEPSLNTLPKNKCSPRLSPVAKGLDPG